MDAVTFTIAGRVLLMVLLYSLALLTIILGYKLYKNGAGFGRDHLVLKFRGFEAHAGSVGSVMMLTACIWAWPFTKAIPSYEKSANGGTRVYSAGKDLVATPMTIHSNGSLASLTSDPKALESSIRQAITRQRLDPDSVLELRGQPASFVADSISVKPDGDGKYMAIACIETARSREHVYFSVSSRDGRITFRPWQVPVAVSPNDDPNGVRLPDRDGETDRMTPGHLPLPDKESEKAMPLPMPDGMGESNASTPSPLPFVP